MTAPALQLTQVSKVYELGGTEIVALDHVDLTVEAHEVVTLLGPSGSGKSTLLSIAGGLLSASSGRVVVGGQDITRASGRKLTSFRRKRVGFIFQAVNLVPFLTARENLLVVAQLARRRPAEAKRRADRLLEELGLGHRTGNLPAQLSGGERQRVAIGRALMNQPALVLVDEPTSALDSDRGQQVMQLIVSEVKARGAAAVIVTHDARMTRYGDRILNMADGRIAGIEPRPEWTHRPDEVPAAAADAGSDWATEPVARPRALPPLAPTASAPAAPGPTAPMAPTAAATPEVGSRPQPAAPLFRPDLRTGGHPRIDPQPPPSPGEPQVPGGLPPGRPQLPQRTPGAGRRPRLPMPADPLTAPNQPVPPLQPVPPQQPTTPPPRNEPLPQIHPSRLAAPRHRPGSEPLPDVHPSGPAPPRPPGDLPSGPEVSPDVHPSRPAARRPPADLPPGSEPFPDLHPSRPAARGLRPPAGDLPPESEPPPDVSPSRPASPRHRPSAADLPAGNEVLPEVHPSRPVAPSQRLHGDQPPSPPGRKPLPRLHPSPPSPPAPRSSESVPPGSEPSGAAAEWMQDGPPAQRRREARRFQMSRPPPQPPVPEPPLVPLDSEPIWPSGWWLQDEDVDDDRDDDG